MMHGGGPTWVAPEHGTLMRAHRSNRTVVIEHSWAVPEMIQARVRIISRRDIHVRGKRLKVKLYVVAGLSLDQRCFLAVMSYDGIMTRCCEVAFMDAGVFWAMLSVYGLNPRDLSEPRVATPAGR